MPRRPPVHVVRRHRAPAPEPAPDTPPPVDLAERTARWLAETYITTAGPMVAHEAPVGSTTLDELLADLVTHQDEPAESGGHDGAELCVWLGGRILATVTRGGVVTRFDGPSRGELSVSPRRPSRSRTDAPTLTLFD